VPKADVQLLHPIGATPIPKPTDHVAACGLQKGFFLRVEDQPVIRNPLAVSVARYFAEQASVANDDDDPVLYMAASEKWQELRRTLDLVPNPARSPLQLLPGVLPRAFC
jgi:hypothetical protein